MENVKNDPICHVTRQNQYNPAGGGATMMLNQMQPKTESHKSSNGIMLNKAYKSKRLKKEG